MVSQRSRQEKASNVYPLECTGSTTGVAQTPSPKKKRSTLKSGHHTQACEVPMSSIETEIAAHLYECHSSTSAASCLNYLISALHKTVGLQ